MGIPSYKLFGQIRIAALHMESALAAMHSLIATKGSSYVCFANVHTSVTAMRQDNLQQAYEQAALVLADGMPVAWYGRWLGYDMERVAGPDFMLRLLQLSPERNYRHFLCGGKPETLERLRQQLAERVPGLQVCGVYSPPFRPLSSEDMQHIAGLINDAAADVVWVGLGAPKQELWMADMQPLLERGVMVGVGAAFDFLAGSVARAPRWMQRTGLEWLHRLAQQPGRLWQRYLVNNTLFLLWWGRDVLRGRRKALR